MGLDDAALWAAVRGLSDAQLRAIQRSVRHFHCAADAQLSQARDASVQLPQGRVRVADFVPIFLDFVHRISAASAPENSPETKSDSDMATLEFPPLKSSVKRRITTTLLTSNLVARPVPSAVAFPPLGASEGTRPPAWAKRSLLEKRMGGEQTTAWGTPQPVSTKTTSPELQLQVKKVKSQVTNSLQNRVEVSSQEEDKQIAAKKAQKTEFQVNRQAAKLYGFLIRERFVGSTCAELQVLISLLYRATCTCCKSETLTDCQMPSEFCWREHCLGFLELVFQEIEPLLMHLGSELLGLVTHSLREADGICSEMLERLEQAMRQREELRVAESARVGCQLPVEMKASAVRDFALPFNEETDSRLHYRTPVESSLYSNREKVRDGFLNLLRQFQQKQHSLVGIENAGVAAAAIASARELLAQASPENRWWFAKFFVQELLQVGSNPFGESDEDLVLKIMEDKLVVKNPDRLRKLHRRFSSQKPLNKSPQPHVNSGNGGLVKNKTSSKGNSNPPRKSRQDTRSGIHEDDATKSFTATLDCMKSFFTDNQLFFFHFLHSCDSYEFSELVKHQLERQFHAIRENNSPTADARKSFTEVVLRLKVVAKFLGYLRFSPQWQVTSSIRQLSEQNAAFKAVEREGISTLEVASDSSLDVKTLLENSIMQSSISKCIPWLCDYLTMLSLDKLSSGTTYFKQLIVLLQRLYRSHRLNSLGETGLYIAMQIERIFHVMKLDAAFLHDDDFLSEELLPTSKVRSALEREDEVSPEESEDGVGEDHLPFLYSQVFVQSCVSELEDLRGFIQTRAQPLPRRKLSTGTGAMTRGQSVTPIRKLRPLQVVIGDGHSGGDISSFTPKYENNGDSSTVGVKPPTTGFPGNVSPLQEENDKLSDAVFKVHPKLKAVVEFVVGNVTTDVCEHVMAQIVIPRADVLVDRCASESGLFSIERSSTLDEKTATAARASFQMLITSKTRQEVTSTVVAALHEALRLGEDRVTAAIPPFMPSSSHPTLTHSIVFVALQRTRGALKTLVPKSSQTEFVKRLAFRNKSVLKDAGWGSKATVTALPSASLATTTVITIPTTGAHQEVAQVREEEQRYRSLKKCIATMSKHASSEVKSPTIAEWERQTTALVQCLSEFRSFYTECVAAGDLNCSAASPLAMTGLVLWDIVWHATTLCLKMLRSSLEVFAAGELLSMKKTRIAAIEKMFTQFVSGFVAVLKMTVQSIVQSVKDDTATSRLQAILAFTMDRVMELPSEELADEGLAKRFAVPASSQVVATLRDVLSTDDDSGQPQMDWARWAALSEHANSPSMHAQFRLNVWDASLSVATMTA